MRAKRVITERMWRLSAVMTMPLIVAGILTAGAGDDSNALPQTAASCTGSGDFIAFGDWECGDPHVHSPWEEIQRVGGAAGERFTRITSNVRQGTYAGRFEVRPGDSPVSSGERVEVKGLGDVGAQGEWRTYGLSVFIPGNWQQCDPAWCIFAQWHPGASPGLPAGRPALSIEAPRGAFGGTPDRLRIMQNVGQCNENGQECTFEAHTVMTGEQWRQKGISRWHDFIIEAHWSINNDGVMRAWHRVGNGSWQQVVNKTGAPTLKRHGSHPVRPVFYKFGLYRGEEDFTRVIYNDSYCVIEGGDKFALAQTCFD